MFTPGPWEPSGPNDVATVQTVRQYVDVVRSRSGWRPRKNAKPYNITICYMSSLFATSTWDRLGVTDLDDARLIARGPEMHGICRDLVALATDSPDPALCDLAARARDAIAGLHPKPHSTHTPEI
jgi:hypothetical protein